MLIVINAKRRIQTKGRSVANDKKGNSSSPVGGVAPLRSYTKVQNTEFKDISNKKDFWWMGFFFVKSGFTEIL